MTAEPRGILSVPRGGYCVRLLLCILCGGYCVRLLLCVVRSGFGRRGSFG